MNKQQASLYSLMTPVDRERLQGLEQQRAELARFRKRIYYQEWFHREGKTHVSALITILIGGLIMLTGFYLPAGMKFYWIPAVLILAPLCYRLVLRQLNKRPSWQTLFSEGIQDYAPKAVLQSNIQWIKNRVQYSSRLDFEDVREWFGKERACIRVRSNDIEARYQYAWFYQSSEIKKDTDEPEGLDAETVTSNCSSFIEIPSRQNKSQEGPQ